MTAAIADDAAALRSTHRALSLPDAIALVIGAALDVDVVWTGDRRWASADSRVVVR